MFSLNKEALCARGGSLLPTDNYGDDAVFQFLYLVPNIVGGGLVMLARDRGKLRRVRTDSQWENLR